MSEVRQCPTCGWWHDPPFMFDIDAPARMAALLAEKDAEIEALKEALGQTTHFVTLTAGGYSIEHLVACREIGMTNCVVHHLVDDYIDGWLNKFGLGRHAVLVSSDGDDLLKVDV